MNTFSIPRACARLVPPRQALAVAMASRAADVKVKLCWLCQKKPGR